jgi:hypothetical protein
MGRSVRRAGPYAVTALPASQQHMWMESTGRADRSTQRHVTACRSKSQTRPTDPTNISQSYESPTVPIDWVIPNRRHSLP